SRAPRPSALPAARWRGPPPSPHPRSPPVAAVGQPARGELAPARTEAQGPLAPGAANPRTAALPAAPAVCPYPPSLQPSRTTPPRAVGSSHAAAQPPGYQDVSPETPGCPSPPGPRVYTTSAASPARPATILRSLH